MALAQLLQPWADESFHYRDIAMTNQGGGQCPQEGAAVRHASPERYQARAKLIRSDFVHTPDSQCHKRALGWNRIINSSGTPE
jgi:hypothetical protein